MSPGIDVIGTFITRQVQFVHGGKSPGNPGIGDS